MMEKKQLIGQSTSRFSVKKITQKSYAPIEIDDNEKDSVMIWFNEGSESNVIIIHRDSLPKIIKLLKGCLKNK